MKKKKLLKEIEFLKRRISAIEKEKEQCKHCENFKAKTVKFVRYRPLPTLVENYISREAVINAVKPDGMSSDAKKIDDLKYRLGRFLTHSQGCETVCGIPIAEFRFVIGEAINNLAKKGDDP